MDSIHDVNPTQLFMKLSLKMRGKINLKTQLLHCDTTNFSVYGNYEHSGDGSTIEITYGHAKDKRDDLKRFGLGMITNQCVIPLFTKAYSGNTSDKESIIKAMKRLKENITFPDDVYYIADSAFYSEDNIRSMGESMKWITRVPQTLTLSKETSAEGLIYRHCLEFGNHLIE